MNQQSLSRALFVGSRIAVLLLGMLAPTISRAQGFSIERITHNAPNLDFEWGSEAGMSYRLWSSADIFTGTTNWTEVATDLDATNTTSMTSIPAPAVDPTYYRMEAYVTPRVRVEMVTVGDAGNPNDSGSTSDVGPSGAVAYEYQIGKYEVTNQEYVHFLNAVDPTGINRLLLYRDDMALGINGGITNNLSNVDGLKYEVKAGFAAKPVVYVRFYDALRFCNWLHNGAVPGGDTDDGAYTLEGSLSIPTNGETVTRNPGAKFTVPTEDEWYKAAYYKPFNQGGDVDHYWLYPTGSNFSPESTAPPGGSPAANYERELSGFTDVGSYTNTVGYYGTFDMAGNASEWIETIHPVIEPELRLQRGGGWNAFVGSLQSANPTSSNPRTDLHTVGFRITGR